MKKQARTKSPGRSKKALADLAPRNTAGVKGGKGSETLAANLQKKEANIINAVIDKVG